MLKRRYSPNEVFTRREDVQHGAFRIALDASSELIPSAHGSALRHALVIAGAEGYPLANILSAIEGPPLSAKALGSKTL